MSSRNVRKLFGTNSLPMSNDSSEDDFEPLCARPSTTCKFVGLELSSESETDNEPVAVSEGEEFVPRIIKKKKNKNKKKNKGQPNLNEPGCSRDNVELDEIDRSVLEVNKLIGSPVEPVQPPKPVPTPLEVIMAINIRDLNSSYELRRVFGPNEEERKRRGRPDNAARLLARAPIVSRGNYPPNYLRPGLSMSIVKREGDITYFCYDHSPQYQKHNTHFLRIVYHTHNVTLFDLTKGQRNMHVEMMLEYTDMLFRAEEYRLANGLLEMTLDYFQIAAHPEFLFTDKGIRLEYEYMENRPFHAAVLKYIYMLSNRACHRTALELAKLLMNLDPTDPLGVLLVIDILALKAGEYKWLIDAIAVWTSDRQADMLYNITFSNALAHFMLATEKKEDLSTADKLLKNALMRFPTMLNAILMFVQNVPSNTVQQEHMFTNYAEGVTSRHVKEVVNMYADLTSSCWHDKAIVKWLLKNAGELADGFNTPEIQAQLTEFLNIRYRCFPYRTRQAVRHMSVIRPMATLISEGTIPDIIRSVAADPLPSPPGVDRHSYLDAMNKSDHNFALVRSFLASLMPNYDERMFDQELPHERDRAADEVNEMLEYMQFQNFNINPIEDGPALEQARAAGDVVLRVQLMNHAAARPAEGAEAPVLIEPHLLAAAAEGAQGNDGNPELNFLTRAMSNAVRSLLQAYRGYDADDEGEQQRGDN